MMGVLLLVLFQTWDRGIVGTRFIKCEMGDRLKR
jgi:hypothetical protein